MTPVPKHSMTSIFTLVASALLLAGPAAAQQQPGWQGQPGRQQQARVPSESVRETGRVVLVRPVRVRGAETPNYLVVVETPDRRRLVADLGQDVRGLDLRRGAPIQLRGEAVRVGPRRVVLLADTVRVGGRLVELDRPAMTVVRQRGPGMASR